MTKEDKNEIKKEQKIQKKGKVDISWRDKIRPGMTVRVHQTIRTKTFKGEEKERVQVFEGIIISRKRKKEKGATFTVRKIAAGGIGVEKIFPLYSPNISQVEIIKQAKVRRAKLYYLRNYKKRLKEIKIR